MVREFFFQEEKFFKLEMVMFCSQARGKRYGKIIFHNWKKRCILNIILQYRYNVGDLHLKMEEFLIFYWIIQNYFFTLKNWFKKNHI